MRARCARERNEPAGPVARRTPGGLKKLAILLASLALAVLLAEGVLSLFLGTSVTHIGRPRSLLDRLVEQDLATDRESYLAAARTVGPYRVPEDPLVANTLKVEAEVDFFEQRFRTDALGLRPRPGPPHGADAFHVVVLGDSVAYGHGLASEQSLAAQLEGVLRAASPPGVREIVCSTVALPGWNYRNSARHLLDHLDRIAPDLVLFVPVENDLDDSYGVSEAGQRRRAEDPGVPHPACVVAAPFDVYRALGLKKLGPRGFARHDDEVHIQDWVITAGLTETARWRLDDMAATLAHLSRRLERVGARLVLAPYHQHDVHRAVRARLLERGVDLPVLALLDEFRSADGLGKNPHPNAETTRALALWAADGLASQGLLPQALGALPEVPAAFAQRRARELSPAELARWRADFERARAASLVARVEPAELVGLLQVYGGLNPDGTLGIDSALVLPPGRRLAVELAAAVDGPGLYPLAITVEVDGERLGELTLEDASSAATAEFPLGPVQARAPFEVRFVAEDWALARVLDRLMPSAARLVSVTSLP